MVSLVVNQLALSGPEEQIECHDVYRLAVEEYDLE